MYLLRKKPVTSSLCSYAVYVTKFVTFQQELVSISIDILKIETFAIPTAKILHDHGVYVTDPLTFFSCPSASLCLPVSPMLYLLVNVSLDLTESRL